MFALYRYFLHTFCYFVLLEDSVMKGFSCLVSIDLVLSLSDNVFFEVSWLIPIFMGKLLLWLGSSILIGVIRF